MRTNISSNSSIAPILPSRPTTTSINPESPLRSLDTLQDRSEDQPCSFSYDWSSWSRYVSSWNVLPMVSCPKVASPVNIVKGSGNDTLEPGKWL